MCRTFYPDSATSVRPNPALKRTSRARGSAPVPGSRLACIRWASKMGNAHYRSRAPFRIT